MATAKVTPIPGGGIRAAPGAKWKPAVQAGGAGSSGAGGGGGGGGLTIQSAAQAMAAAAGAPGAGAPPTPVPGGGGGPATTQVQLSPGVGSAIGEASAELARLKARPPDPNLQKQIDRLEARMSSDTTGRAIDKAGSAITDAAAARKSAFRTEQARRGTLGTGVGDQGEGQINAAADRLKAGSASDIALGREAQLDALTLGGQGIMAAPGQLDLAREGQVLGAIGQQGGLAGDQERIAQGWAGVGDAARRTDIASREQAQGQYLALLRMLMGGAYA